MRFFLAFIALLGFIAAGLALREHYRTDASPCSINERWDCGIVNHSPFAVMAGIPVAVIGMAGYLLMGTLALKRAYRLLLGVALIGLAFSLYLAHVEKDILGVWCVYCVASLAAISLLTLLTFGTIVISRLNRPVTSSL
ncbi:MAG: vitamin K epoxide reductase family protein [Terriglobales bacterium]